MAENGAVPGDHIRPKSLSKVGPDKAEQDIARLNVNEASADAHSSYTRTPQLSALGAFWHKPQPRDITKDFSKASSELHLGQLIKDESFTLFESVGALEIMDPKMDSGFSVPEEDEAMEQFDPMSHVLPEEIIGLMDQMLCYDMSWHEGYPLSQTLFTSLHLNNLLSSDNKPLDKLLLHTSQYDKSEPGYTLATKVLRAYCLGIAKSCDLVIREILSEHYYEEEDFVTQTFTRDLLSMINDNDVIRLLAEATASLSALNLSDSIKSAIKDRLELRQALLEAYSHTQAGPKADSREYWNAVIERLGPVEKSHSLGKLVPEAFSVRVQKFLASNTPPRPMIKVTWSEAFTKLRRMCEDNVAAYKLCDLAHTSNPHAFMRFAWDFSSRKPQPCTYSRALIQGLLFKDGVVTVSEGPGIPHVDLLVTDLRELVMSGDAIFDPVNWEIEIPADPRYQMARKVDEFLAKAMEEYLNLYRMVCQNRCRIRRTFSQSVAILDSLQAMAEDLDADILRITQSAAPRTLRPEQSQFYPLSAWVYTHKLQVMQHAIQLGFELDVYLPDELASMYCFLAHLSGTRSDHLRHLIHILRSRHKRPTSSNDTALALECKSSQTFLTILSTQADIILDLANALGIIYSLLNTLHLLPCPERPYSTPALRHELRMKPFLPVGTPHIPSHAELDAACIPPSSAKIVDLLAGAETALKGAKRGLQVLKTTRAEDGKFVGVEDGWRKEVQGLLLSTIAAGVAVAAIRGLCERVGVKSVGDVKARKEQIRGLASVTLPKVEQRYAAWWVVPKVVVKG